MITEEQRRAHHVLRENQWGKAAELFPRAKGLGVTATPVRADGKGLGPEPASRIFETDQVLAEHVDALLQEHPEP